MRPAMAAQVDVLEDRLVLSGPGVLAIGSDQGASAINVLDKNEGFLLYQFNPYPDVPGFRGGVRTAVGYVLDFNLQPLHEVIIAAPGPGLFIPNPNAPGAVRIFSARGGTLSNGFNLNPGQIITSFNPYPGFGGGVNVAAADFDRDGFVDVVTGADEGGGPHVRIVSLSPATPFRLLFDSFVYSPNFDGGVRVGTGNVTLDIGGGDVFPDLIVGAGPRGGPHVKVFSFNGSTFSQIPGSAGSFFAFNPLFTGGIYVAAGNFAPISANDTRAEVVVGAGQTGGPHVRVIDIFGPDPNDGRFDLFNRFVFDINFTGGVRVGAGYINGDNLADLIVATGPGGNFVRVFNTTSGFTLVTPSGRLYEGPGFPGFFGGLFPSTGKFLLTTINSTEPLQIDPSAEPPVDGVSQITTDDVQSIAQAAIDRFAELGLSQSLLDELGGVQIKIANLADGFLGLAGDGYVILDDDAAGFGWFIDPTPFDDNEFGPDGYATDPAARNRVDLLTTLLHEFGHNLGLEDLDSGTHSGQLMNGTLNVGERRVPQQNALDILFSGDTLLDRLLAPSLF
jgi:hypothetical protein